MVLNEETGHIIGIGKATYNRLSEWLASPCCLLCCSACKFSTLPLRWALRIPPFSPPPLPCIPVQSILGTLLTRWQAPSHRRPPAQTRPPGPGAAARPGGAAHPEREAPRRGWDGAGGMSVLRVAASGRKHIMGGSTALPTLRLSSTA